MQSVDLVDISGVRMLESILRLYRTNGGDVFLTRVREPVLDALHASGFVKRLGENHLLDEDTAIEHLFYRVLDPAICIYESGVRVFKECQNLPRPDYAVQIPLLPLSPAEVREVAPRWLWERLREPSPPLVVDVREPREFAQGRIPQAHNIPLPKLLAGDADELPGERPLILVCRSGRRSARAAMILRERGFENVTILRGGMQAWESEKLLTAVG
jgi:SulP family sulfate permease